MNTGESESFLRVPPFPGAKVASIRRSRSVRSALNESSAESVVAEIARLRVGGDYWAKQPSLPEAQFTLIKLAEPAGSVVNIETEGPILFWTGQDQASAPLLTNGS